MYRLLLLACLWPVLACRSDVPPSAPPPARIAAGQPIDHGAFSEVLARYVDARGRVDYAGLKRDRALDPYLAVLAAADPAARAREEQLAFWINAYNAGALKLVVDHYPVSTILRITPNRLGIPIPGTAQMPFRIRFHRVGGRLYTLDEIEHAILRGRFAEPRIHAALVCAAVSCPPLRREAYTARRLDAQLDAQMRAWLHDPARNRIPDTDGRIALSRIFDWFSDDFGGSDAAVQRYVARYFDGPLRARLARGGFRVSYLRYNWDLNAR